MLIGGLAGITIQFQYQQVPCYIVITLKDFFFLIKKSPHITFILSVGIWYAVFDQRSACNLGSNWLTAQIFFQQEKSIK